MGNPLLRRNRSQTRRTSSSSVILAIVLAAAPLWGGETATAHVKNFGEVHADIYRGGAPSLIALQELKELGVKTVVDLRETGKGTEVERAQTEHLGMKYVNVPLRPWSAPTAEEVRTALALLENSPGPVFIHCRRGKDRTGTVVACYRIEHDKWANRRALEEANGYGMSHAERAMRAFVLQFTRSAEAIHP